MKMICTEVKVLNIIRFFVRETLLLFMLSFCFLFFLLLLLLFLLFLFFVVFFFIKEIEKVLSSCAPNSPTQHENMPI